MNKKTVEKLDLEKLIKYGKLPLVIIDDKEERPDFIAKYNNLSIGIEHTKYTHLAGKDKNSHLRWQCSLKRITDMAMERFREINANKNAWFSIGFFQNKTLGLAKKGERDLAERIARFCAQLDFSVIGIGAKQIHFMCYYDKLPELSTMYVHIDEIQTNVKWVNYTAFSSKEINLSRLDAIICKKSRDIQAPDYRVCDQHWLLIVIDWFGISVDCVSHLPDNSLSLIRKHGFDRVFIINNAINDHVINLTDFLREI